MSQLQEAQKQLKDISVAEIKEILKTNYPTEYSKMIIDETAPIQRVDYYHSKLDYIKADRKLNLIQFPLFDNIKDDFKFFEGGVPKFGNQTIVEHEHYLSEFANKEGATINENNVEEGLSFTTFPFDTSDNDISFNQRKYFLPKDTFQETCTKCSGNKYITCTRSECGGKHEWKCNKCVGKGETTCTKCNGHKYNKCYSCSGTGKKTKTEYRDGKSYQKTEKCGSCSGKGEKPCGSCGTSGKVRCNNCKGSGQIVCSTCYSDKARYGTIDCSKCHTAGKSAQIFYLDTNIDNLQESRILKLGEEFEIETEIIKNHINEELSYNLLYKNINGLVTDNSDKISSKILPTYENDLNLSKTNHPLLLNAKILYQIIPCISISYKHMLTNEIHTINVVDIWNNPELIFLSDAELTKTNIKSVGKSAGKLFSKIFKTKGHKLKEDRKIEIKLMIYLAKSDGKIEEEEKTFLASEISNLEDFTNSEKNIFFDLMNAEVLPELTKEDVTFNDTKRGKEVIVMLEKMALADGEFEPSEKELIEKLKTLL
ncbi:MAG: hypothetical protein PSN34_14790 [Urechidicola sp.]|nr:hypothetical protein [Urechidicola sp.]